MTSETYVTYRYVNDSKWGTSMYMYIENPLGGGG